MLGPQNRGDLGIEPFNSLLQSELNPKRAPNEVQWEVGPYKIRLDDRVIHCKNNYNLRVFNGEIGVVQGLDGEKMFVDWAGQKVPAHNSHDGCIEEASVFIAVLGASNKTYAEAFANERSPAPASFAPVVKITVPW